MRNLPLVLSLPLVEFGVALGVAWLLARLVAAETVLAWPRTRLVALLLPDVQAAGSMTSTELDRIVDAVRPDTRGWRWHVAYLATCPYCAAFYTLAAVLWAAGQPPFVTWSNTVTWAAGWAALRLLGK